MTLWLTIMHHHTPFGYKRLRALERIIWTNPRHTDNPPPIPGPFEFALMLSFCVAASDWTQPPSWKQIKPTSFWGCAESECDHCNRDFQFSQWGCKKPQLLQILTNIILTNISTLFLLQSLRARMRACKWVSVCVCVLNNTLCKLFW